VLVQELEKMLKVRAEKVIKEYRQKLAIKR
jgi:hypothetical protein